MKKLLLVLSVLLLVSTLNLNAQNAPTAGGPVDAPTVVNFVALPSEGGAVPPQARVSFGTFGFSSTEGFSLAWVDIMVDGPKEVIKDIFLSSSLKRVTKGWAVVAPAGNVIRLTAPEGIPPGVTPLTLFVDTMEDVSSFNGQKITLSVIGLAHESGVQLRGSWPGGVSKTIRQDIQVGTLKVAPLKMRQNLTIGENVGRQNFGGMFLYSDAQFAKTGIIAVDVDIQNMTGVQLRNVDVINATGKSVLISEKGGSTQFQQAYPHPFRQDVVTAHFDFAVTVLSGTETFYVVGSVTGTPYGDVSRISVRTTPKSWSLRSNSGYLIVPGSDNTDVVILGTSVLKGPRAKVTVEQIPFLVAGDSDVPAARITVDLTDSSEDLDVSDIGVSFESFGPALTNGRLLVADTGQVLDNGGPQFIGNGRRVPLTKGNIYQFYVWYIISGVGYIRLNGASLGAKGNLTDTSAAVSWDTKPSYGVILPQAFAGLIGGKGL